MARTPRRFHQKHRTPYIRQIWASFCRGVSRQVCRVSHLHHRSAAWSFDDRVETVQAKGVDAGIPGCQPARNGGAARIAPCNSSTRGSHARPTLGHHSDVLQNGDDFGQSSIATSTPTGLDRSKLASSGNAMGMPTCGEVCSAGEPPTNHRVGPPAATRDRRLSRPRSDGASR